ncbi:MAG: putative zinc-binding metallopeptidase [Planctomycetota bacterium]
MSTRKTGRRPRPPAWTGWSDEKLLQVPLRDLDLRIEGTALEGRVERIQADLDRCDIRLTPTFWLSDEWFTPMGVTGVAIPFFLAHPRLARLEKSQMLEVEGGTHDWCMRILRHEIGHVVDNAWQLRRRRRRQKLFGSATTPYPETYLPKPYSKSFVRHLDQWYAQSHPDEDFAETFAVWFTPKFPWRRRYAGWKALRKLEYLDELMGEIAGTKPPVATRRKVDCISRNGMTLGEYYEQKRERYAVDYPSFFDRDLRRLFTGEPGDRSLSTAASFIRSHRRDLTKLVARGTGTYRYTIRLVVDDMIARCRELGLRASGAEEDLRAELTVLLTVQTMNFVLSGRHRVTL